MKTIKILAPGKVETEEIPLPIPQKGEALLKVLYGGICGSDLGTTSRTGYTDTGPLKICARRLKRFQVRIYEAVSSLY